MKEITTKQIKDYCKREKAVQKNTYPNLVANRKMSNSQEKEYAAIIQDFETLAETLDKKGIKWSELLLLIESQEDSQKSLF